MTQTMATTPTTLPQTTAPSSQTATQRTSRSSRAPLPSTASTEYNYIGLYVVSNGGARFTRATTRNTVARCDPPFINRRNVSCELSDLDPCEGGYTMMACTYNPEMEGSFYLKVFSDQPLQDLEPPVVPVSAVSAVSAVSGGNEGTEMEEMEETEETEEKTTTGGQVGGRESGSGDGDGGLGSGGSGGGSGSGGQKQKAAKKAAKKAGKSLRRLTSRDPVV